MRFCGQRITLVGKARLRFLRDAARTCLWEDVKGCFVECGVWRGGSAGEVLRILNPVREAYLFDSFEGMPKATEADVDFRGRSAAQLQNQGLPLAGDESDITLCRKYLTSLGLDLGRVHIIPGWFETTFPHCVNRIPHIALLHVDCDWYESVKLTLTTWFPKVAAGGFVVIDDYGHWQGCKKAVDEYLPNARLTKIDRTGVWLRKEAQ